MKTKYWVGYYDDAITNEKKRFFIADDYEGLPGETNRLHDVQLIKAESRIEAKKIFIAKEAALELLEALIELTERPDNLETFSQIEEWKAKTYKAKAAIQKATN